MGLIKLLNNNATENSLDSKMFPKVAIPVEISIFLKSLVEMIQPSRRRPCSTIYSPGNLVDGSPRAAIKRSEVSFKNVGQNYEIFKFLHFFKNETYRIK